ncbi:hypothetical protein JCM16303_005978 [Sporobolomyces ruberrimus]
MRVSLLPVPLALALLSCSPSTSFARSSSSLQLPSTSHDHWAPLYRPETASRLARVKRQILAGDGTTGGGTQTGDTQTGGDTAAGGGSDTSQAAASSAADTATSPAATTSQAPTTTPAASSPESQTQQTTQQPATTTSQQTTAPATTQQTTQTSQQATTSPANTSPTVTTPTAAASSATSALTSSTETSATDSASSASSSSESIAQSQCDAFPYFCQHVLTRNLLLAGISFIEVTFTSTFTNADGSVGTSTGTLQSASSVPVKQNNSSNAGKIWGIVGGVVGGIVVILIGAFVVYRLSQRRFSNLDDNVDEIKWPELQPDGQTVSMATSTLRPLDTHRTGGAGIGDDGDEWDSSEPFMANGTAGGAGGMGERRYSSGTMLSMSQNAHEASYEQLAMADQGGYPSHQPQGHYDPFLGPSSAPYPPPQNVYPPSPYTSSPSLSGSPKPGSSPSFTSGPAGAPGAGGAIREGSPPPPRDPFASTESFRALASPSPHNYGNNYGGGPL